MDEADFISIVNTQVSMKTVCVWSWGWREVIAKWRVHHLFPVYSGKLLWLCESYEYQFSTLYFLFMLCLRCEIVMVNTLSYCVRPIFMKSLPPTIVIIKALFRTLAIGCWTAVVKINDTCYRQEIIYIFPTIKRGNLI